jgi:putative flippase GtrA
MKMKMFDQTTLKFILTGIANTLVGTAVMYSLYNFAGFSYWISSAANYVIGSLLSYILNRNFTFKHKGSKIGSLIKFIINIALCYIIAYGIAKRIAFFFLKGWDQHIRDNIAMAFGMVIFVGLNYFGQRFFVFSKRNASSRQI